MAGDSVPLHARVGLWCGLRGELCDDGVDWITRLFFTASLSVGLLNGSRGMR